MYLFTCLGVATCYIGLAFCYHETYNEQAALSRSKKGFEESRLVPDLLSTFDPQGTLAIHFADDKVLRRPGFPMSARDTQASPSVQLYPESTGQLDSAEKFTLIMVDPDSPIHANPSGAKLHLLATDLALDRHHEPVETYTLLNNTRFLFDWHSPNPEPRTGVHRYTFLLYKGVASQTSQQPLQAPDFNSSGFNLAQFTRDAGLQNPYAAAFMNVDSASNAQGNSASGRSIDVYTLSTTIALSVLAAIYLS
ncbi:hypothetical protein PTTG_07664 [Puccinia triticina 1-1 BBBD Race 1]|uniref:Phosphatidylethanolamine-binding protein n=2 Tax=Puccinia triticina TaxID=208348 RepID=A0A180GIZ9_PUCT1|nr:uncharacterized protein PtA15_2A812 [Puccinia triticina]OAV92680.1 hypothetical protein PTTG_07664 [Puccinia triticina 1-1 BBBD Race 1]WAQ82495.1 hypothetical protein PtA15_2A812 [Puccinia triticina]WAR53348.1 hypothetical protein PtB15_2B779 [Puccinia triticina]